MGKDDVCIIGFFDDKFMKKYTKFSSFDQMKAKSPLNDVDTSELFDNKRWDKFVKKNTQFDSWQDMLLKSANSQLKENKF